MEWTLHWRLRKNIVSAILYRPLCGAVLHHPIWPHPFCLLIQVRCFSFVHLWTGKLLASADLKRRLVESLVWTLVCPPYVCLWIGNG